MAYNAVAGPAVGSFVKTDADVRDMQQRVRAARDELGAIVVTCGAKLSPAVKEQWTDVDLRAKFYVDEEPAFWTAASQYDRGVAIYAELETWRKRLAAAGCADVPPQFNVPDANPIDNVLDKLLLLAGILGGVYVASKLLK